jgi:hypothetical protein
VRTPSKHKLGKQVKPDTGVFVQDAPEGSAAEQSPAVSALKSSSDVSQVAKKMEVQDV